MTKPSRRIAASAADASGILMQSQAAIVAAGEAAQADIDHLAFAAEEGAVRMRRATMLLMAELDRGRLVDAAHIAGQLAMLSRMVEIRLLSAIERRAGAKAVAKAASAVFAKSRG